MKHSTRESWLKAAFLLLAPRFAKHGKLPKKIQVQVSWPKSSSSKVIGECFPVEWSADKSTCNISISPVLDSKDPARILDVMLHEMVHAIGKHGHGPDFKKVATSLGLTGHMKATTATEPLTKELKALAKKLGPYPHVQMKNLKEKKKVATGGPVTLVSPVEEGLTIYISPNRLEEFGAPLCPISNKPMVVREKGKGYSKKKKEDDDGGEGDE